MENQKKAYVKPEFTIYPAGSPKYNKIIALMKTEGKVKQQNLPKGPKSEVPFLSETWQC